jgi:hypothetical protein
MIREGEPKCWRCEPLTVKIDCMMQQHLNQMISVDSKGQKPLLGDRRNPFDQLQIEIVRIVKENPDRIRLIKSLTEEVNMSRSSEGNRSQSSDRFQDPLELTDQTPVIR